MRQLLIIIIFILFSIGNAIASNEADSTVIVFKTIITDSVEVGKQFRVNFEFNAEGGKNFKAPEIKELKVLYGPSTSTSMSTMIQGGKMTKKVAVTISYILQAEKEGTFKIPSASIFLDETEYKTQEVEIKVVKRIDDSIPPTPKEKKEDLPYPSRKQEKKPQTIFI